MKTQRAFTLVELLFYISLLGLITLLAWPNLQHFYQQQKSKHTALRLYSFLQYARQSALLQGRTLAICADNGQRYCHNDTLWENPNLLLFRDDNQNGLRDDNEEIIYTLDLSQNFGSIQWRSFGNKPYLQWQNNGMTFFQNGSFLYCPNHRKEQYAALIVVNVLGRLYFANNRDANGILTDSNGNTISCQG